MPKNKTFFFVGYEGIRESRGIPVLRTVYTAEARQGIFRYLDDIGTLGTTPEAVAANPGRIRSVNLFACGAGIRTALNRDCVDSRFNAAFPATVDPTVASLMAKIPLPNNFDVGDGLNTGGFRFNAKSLTGQDTPSIRLDHKFNDRHNFYSTFNYLDRRIAGEAINGREPQFPDIGRIGDRVTHSRSFSGTLASTFTNSLVNEFRGGWTAGPERCRKRPSSGRSAFWWTSISRSAHASRNRPTSNFAGRFSIFSITSISTCRTRTFKASASGKSSAPCPIRA